MGRTLRILGQDNSMQKQEFEYQMVQFNRVYQLHLNQVLTQIQLCLQTIVDKATIPRIQ